MSTLHDTDSRGFASDNYAGAHPEIIAAIAEANGGHQISYGEDAYTARLQEVMAGHLGPGRRGLPGLQRHRRQRAVAAIDAAPLGCGDLHRDRAHQHRRERRPGTGRRDQAADRPDAGRQAHPRADRPAGLRLGRRAPGAAARRLDHPDHRTRHRLHPGRDPGDRRPHPPAGHAPAPGRGPDRQRRSQSRRAAASLHHRRRGRRRVLRRHQERPAVR